MNTHMQIHLDILWYMQDFSLKNTGVDQGAGRALISLPADYSAFRMQIQLPAFT